MADWLKMQVLLIHGFEYKAGIKKFPLVLQFSSNQMVEIAKEIDVATVLLESLENEDIYFGHQKCVLRFPRKAFVLNAGDVHKVHIDVLEDSDEHEAEDDALAHLKVLISGAYRLWVEAIAYRKVDAEDFEPVGVKFVGEIEVLP
ncbi:hypothetical protein GLA29479_3219 [Lysobacter antibioticus]|uniref:hypothetical protein n=1 Tax=Lysobacter antibioticus TaxID=84531 RepID=UPI0007171495|nr:hypothetical protein [Lysobacter antibioticus]ALN64073.1 hypothetical protein GLA29479_3219 [Lysobacter antibioticus]